MYSNYERQHSYTEDITIQFQREYTPKSSEVKVDGGATDNDEAAVVAAARAADGLRVAAD